MIIDSQGFQDQTIKFVARTLLEFSKKHPNVYITNISRIRIRVKEIHGERGKPMLFVVDVATYSSHRGFDKFQFLERITFHDE